MAKRRIAKGDYIVQRDGHFGERWGVVRLEEKYLYSQLYTEAEAIEKAKKDRAKMGTNAKIFVRNGYAGELVLLEEEACEAGQV
jgi:hypothetical protein